MDNAGYLGRVLLFSAHLSLRVLFFPFFDCRNDCDGSSPMCVMADADLAQLPIYSVDIEKHSLITILRFPCLPELGRLVR